MTPPEQEPMWSDERINMVEPRYTDKAHLMKQIRDDERKPLLERIAELEQTIEDAKTHSLTSSAPCPLCEYDNGMFIKSCQMHKEIFHLLGVDDDEDALQVRRTSEEQGDG